MMEHLIPAQLMPHHHRELKMRAIPGMLINLICFALPDCLVAEELRSGPVVGDLVFPFDVKDCTGPAAGKFLCYRCQYAGRPTVSIFIRDVDEQVTSLVQQLDKTVLRNRRQRLAAFLVLLTDDPRGGQKKLRALAKKQALFKMPLTIFADPDGPNHYNIASQANVTISMWGRNGRTTSNHVFTKGKLNEEAIEAIVSSTTAIFK